MQHVAIEQSREVIQTAALAPHVRLVVGLDSFKVVALITRSLRSSILEAKVHVRVHVIRQPGFGSVRVTPASRLLPVAFIASNVLAWAPRVRLEVQIVALDESVSVSGAHVSDDWVINVLAVADLERRWSLDVRAYTLRRVLLRLDEELSQITLFSSWEPGIVLGKLDSFLCLAI